MGPEMSIIVLTGYEIFAYVYVFPILNSFICKYYMCHVWHVVLA